MKKSNIKIVSAVLLAILFLAALPMTVFAATPGDVVLGNNYTLENGQTLKNDLIVLGGNVDLKQGSTIIGNVFILGGNAQAAGTISGNMVVLGGSLYLGQTFVLNGNLTTAGGSVNRAPGATINGQVNTNVNTPSIVLPNGIQIPTIPTFNPFVNVGVKIVGYFAGLILWTLVAMVLAMFLSVPLTRTSQTELKQPLLSGGLGLLTVVVAPIILVLLAITICLSPIAALGLIVLLVAGAYGLIAMGLELGKRISAAFKHEWHPAIEAGVGTLVLMAILNGLEAFLPCIGWIPLFLASIVGLGAVLLTQFGRKDYPQLMTTPTSTPGAALPPASGSDMTPVS